MQHFLRSIPLWCVLALISACGGGGGGGHSSSSTPVTPTVPTGDNVQAISVNGGLTGTVNVAYTSVTVCIPDTTQCQTINNIAIDTGSSGLRVLASALNGMALPQQTTALNHPLVECLQFADLSHVWGPVKLADIKISGEAASSVPIQVIGDTAFSDEPVTCANGDSSTNMDSIAKLGGNGILGIGVFQQDCGDYCALYTANNLYYDCPNTSCTQTTVITSRQLHNPVALFAHDNNGVAIDLPAIPDNGSARVDGWMIFGIGTRENNTLGGAATYTVDNTGYLITNYKSTNYPRSFIDSGSNGLFFPDTTIPNCAQATGFYCPNATQRLSATIIGLNNSTSSISYNVTSAETLNGSFTAFNDLAGPYSSGFDWGLPFFFGRKVYTGLETNPGGAFIAF